MIILDTNVVIGFLRGVPPRLIQRFEEGVASGDFALTTITLFELHYGVARSPRRTENADRVAVFLQLPIAVLAFESEDSEQAGEIRAVLERQGRPIGPFDLLIAAQARRRDALLVTANTREFLRVPGLRVEDWAAP